MRSNSPAAAVQTGREIGQMLFFYATDNTQNGNAYPDGASSTEVFQKLLDGNYGDDPSVFYVPMPGKIRPEPGQKKLKPENVSWDVTGGVDSSSGEPIPLVFLTGWKVDYVAGGAAVPLVKPYPRWTWDGRPQSWFEWPLRWPVSYDMKGMVVFYKGNVTSFRNIETRANGDGSIPNFIPTDFKPDGHLYRQLTPEGVLP